MVSFTGSTRAGKLITKNAADTIKRVYRNKAITDIRKLVTEGYIKIERSTGDVSIAVEKVNL